MAVGKHCDHCGWDACQTLRIYTVDFDECDMTAAPSRGHSVSQSSALEASHAKVELIQITAIPLTVFFSLVIIAATGVSLPAGIAVALLAALLMTVVATFASAILPDRVGQHFDRLYRDVRVVAGDQQFAAARTLFGGLVANGQA